MTDYDTEYPQTDEEPVYEQPTYEEPAPSGWALEQTDPSVFEPEVDISGTVTWAVEELAAAMDGIGTDEARVYGALSTVTGNPEAVAALRQAFWDRQGRTLDEALADELSGPELDQAMRYLW